MQAESYRPRTRRPDVGPAARAGSARSRYLGRPASSLAGAAIASAGVALEGWRVSGTSGPTGVDRTIDRLVFIPYDRFGTGLDTVLNHVVAAMVLVAVLIALWSVSRRRLTDGCLVVLSTLVSAGLVDLVKPLVGRHHGASPQFAYPSGHEAIAVALALSSSLLVRDAARRSAGGLAVRGLCALLPVLLGVAVIGLRWHYPTDVFAGAGLGAGATIVVAHALDTVCRLTR